MITFNPFYLAALVILIGLLGYMWELITERLHTLKLARTLLPITETIQPYVWKSVKVLTDGVVESPFRPLTDEGRNRVRLMTVRETAIVDYCNDYIPCGHTIGGRRIAL